MILYSIRSHAALIVVALMRQSDFGGTAYAGPAPSLPEPWPYFYQRLPRALTAEVLAWQATWNARKGVGR